MTSWSRARAASVIARPTKRVPPTMRMRIAASLVTPGWTGIREREGAVTLRAQSLLKVADRP